MKNALGLLIIYSLLTWSCNQRTESSQGENFLQNVDQNTISIINESDNLNFFRNSRSPKKEVFELLPTGSVRPKGWIKAMMQEDLNEGIVGALDDLYLPIVDDNLFNTNRRGSLDDVPDMGDLVLTGAAWETSIMWWNSETAGNWWDGFVRHAFLLEDENAITQSKAIIQNLLDSQDEDGYIGIYKPTLRYKHEGSNGELWAQTTAFRTMLAYYELSGEEKVLEAVERAMRLTMKEYGESSRNPFFLKNEYGGVTHGLMLTDVCETLFRITGNQKYQDYAVFLYEAFSTYSVNRSFNDLRYTYLSERDSMLTGHGVHTYEHYRTVINALYQTGYPELELAFENAEYKLNQVMLPSGAGHGNEWIAGLKADPNKTSTEFCTMLELRNSFGSILQKTGNIKYADRAEKLTFNAIMGFRNHNGTAIAYGKGDNSLVLDGHHHEDGEKREDARYKYSPVHDDVAVCCVPNYSRNLTYYLDNMWMKKEDGLAAVLYGPAILNTSWNGTQISVEQTKSYPFSDVLEFEISTDEEVELAFYFREPEWAESIDLSIDDAQITKKGGYYRLFKKWSGNDVIKLKFKYKTKLKELDIDESYVQRGPLVYSYPIEYKTEIIKSYKDEKFNDYYVYALDDNFSFPLISSSSLLNPKINKASNDSNSVLWNNPPYSLTGVLPLDNGSNKQVTLVPMGSTVLRKITFKKEN